MPSRNNVRQKRSIICYLRALLILLSFLTVLGLMGCVWLPLQPTSYETGPVHLSAVHEVQQGETLEDIAKAFDTTPAAIAVANNLDRLDTPPVGTELRIPRKTYSRPALRELLHRPSVDFIRMWHPSSNGEQESEPAGD